MFTISVTRLMSFHQLRVASIGAYASEDSRLKTVQRLLFVLPLASTAALAMDYTVDFSRIDNLESIRPLVQQCGDFDALEIYRSKMENSTNLEALRSTLSSVDFVLFNKCLTTFPVLASRRLGSWKPHRPRTTR